MTAPKPDAFALSICIVLFILLMTGCSKEPPEVQTKLVAVPSAKPYRFITYTPQTDESTARQIRRHNRTHQEVINTETKAKR